MGQRTGTSFTATDEVTSVPIRTPMFDSDGNITRTWVAFFQSIRGTGGGGSQGPAGPEGPAGPAGAAGASGLREGLNPLSLGGGGSTIQVDLADGKHQHIVLTAAMEAPGTGGGPPTTIVSFLPPIWTGETIQEGDTFVLHVDQDLSGYHPLPLFATGAGGWAADSQIEISPMNSTVMEFTFVGGLWRLTGVKRNVATA